MSQTQPSEIKAFARIMDELNYYELLEIERGAARTDIRDAFHNAARRFHPDTHREAGAALSQDIDRISKRITEAYTVLRNPRRRKVYDDHIAAGTSGVRIPLAALEAAAEKEAAEVHQGATPNGKRYYALANADIKNGNLQAAARNLQMAITFEPGNKGFKEKLEKLKAQLKA